MSRDTTDVFLDSVGGDASCDAEILYLTAASDMPEQTEVGAAVVDFQVLYGISLSVKSSAEHGNAFVVFVREVNIVLKKYGFALRPCVKRAFFGQLHEVFCCFYVYNTAVFTCRKARDNESKQKRENC